MKMQTFDIEYYQNKFKQRLRKLLIKNRWSQSRLSREANIHESTVSQLINKNRLPQLDIAIKIANAFNVSLDSLCGESNYKMNKETLKNVKPALYDFIKPFIKSKTDYLALLTPSWGLNNKTSDIKAVYTPKETQMIAKLDTRIQEATDFFLHKYANIERYSNNKETK